MTEKAGTPPPGLPRLRLAMPPFFYERVQPLDRKLNLMILLHNRVPEKTSIYGYLISVEPQATGLVLPHYWQSPPMRDEVEIKAIDILYFVISGLCP